jgi:hypothetical protein
MQPTGLLRKYPLRARDVAGRSQRLRVRAVVDDVPHEATFDLPPEHR